MVQYGTKKKWYILWYIKCMVLMVQYWAVFFPYLMVQRMVQSNGTLWYNICIQRYMVQYLNGTCNGTIFPWYLWYIIGKLFQILYGTMNGTKVMEHYGTIVVWNDIWYTFAMVHIMVL